MDPTFSTLFPSFMGKYDLAWKVLSKLEGQLRAAGKHQQTVGSPTIDLGLLDKLEPLSYEISLPGYDDLAERARAVQAKLLRANGFKMSDDEVFGFVEFRDREIPELVSRTHALVTRARLRVWLYFAAGILILLSGCAAWLLHVS